MALLVEIFPVFSNPKQKCQNLINGPIINTKNNKESHYRLSKNTKRHMDSSTTETPRFSDEQGPKCPKEDVGTTAKRGDAVDSRFSTFPTP